MPQASPPQDVAAHARRMFYFLIVLTIASQVGIQGWASLFNNFAVERAGFGGFEVGVTQSLREVPGFLSLLVVYVLMVLPEHRVVALAIVALGAGLGLTGLFPSFWGIAATSILMSFGFHYYETLNMSLTLQYFDRSQAPLVFGRLRSVTALSNIAVGLGVLAATRFLDYPAIYGLLGGCVVLAGLWALTKNPSHAGMPVQRKKMFLKRKYSVYYALTFLAGARRQVLTTFAVFLLVKKFGMGVTEITALFLLNNIVNVFANPLIGRAINRFGERGLLTFEYAIVALVFTTYAYSDSKLLVCSLYVIDQLFFNFAMCVGTYFQKIAEPEDLSPTLAAGFTINHIAAVAIPVAGGALWLWDPRLVFLGGVVLSLCSLVVVQFIRTPEKGGEAVRAH